MNQALGQAPPTRVDGRTRLLDTAETLLDQHGIDGVSIRTVTKASGHRNASAVSYHFGTREQLIEAVLTRRQAGIEARRAEMLDALDARADATTLDYLAAALMPVGEMLNSTEGRRYLRLLFQAANHPDHHTRTALDYSPTIRRAAARVMPLVEHLPPELRLHRLRLTMNLGLTALADQALLIDAQPNSRPVLDKATFDSDLLAALRGALSG